MPGWNAHVSDGDRVLGTHKLDHPLAREMDDAVLRTIARLDGTPFPSMTRLTSRWLQGRVPHRKRDTPHPDLAAWRPMRPWARRSKWKFLRRPHPSGSCWSGELTRCLPGWRDWR